MKSVNFHFTGLMCPVFTPFTADKKTINYDVIDAYANWLKQQGIKGVLVNGTTGEGTTLRVDERKRVTEEWVKVCRKYEIVCMVQITGTGIADAYELATHAENAGVCAVLCLPDLFFKPTCEEDLVNCLRDIASYCPTRPLYYYHIPEFTHVYLNMARFCDLAEQSIPTFCGLKYTNGDLAQGSACLKSGRNIILGADTILCGALALGFDAAILTTLNICPEYSIQCYNAIRDGKLAEAQAAQKQLTRRVGEITRNGSGDWVETMKVEFNKLNPSLNCGPWRKPLLKLNKKN